MPRKPEITDEDVPPGAMRAHRLGRSAFIIAVGIAVSVILFLWTYKPKVIEKFFPPVTTTTIKSPVVTVTSTPIIVIPGQAPNVTVVIPPTGSTIPAPPPTRPAPPSTTTTTRPRGTCVGPLCIPPVTLPRAASGRTYRHPLHVM